MKQSDVKFFRPLWLRLLVTAVCVVWFGLEVVFGRDPLWIGITAISIGYCVWNFFLRFPKAEPATTALPGETPPSPTQEAPRQP